MALLYGLLFAALVMVANSYDQASQVADHTDGNAAEQYNSFGPSQWAGAGGVTTPGPVVVTKPESHDDPPPVPQSLLAATAPGTSYTGEITRHNGVSQPINLVFTERNGSVIRAEISNPDKPSQKRVLTGGIQFSPTRDKGDSTDYLIVMNPTDNGTKLIGMNCDLFEGVYCTSWGSGDVMQLRMPRGRLQGSVLSGRLQGDVLKNMGDLSSGNGLMIRLHPGKAAAAESSKITVGHGTTDGKTVRVLEEITIDLGNGVKLEMVLIPTAEFMMGTAGSSRDEKQHRVRITKPFCLGKYLVTQEQWQAVMGNNPSYFRGERNPVEKVSWDDCQEFIKKLNAKVGGGEFSLPTEAQWEYSCRAGSTGKYCFGDDVASLGDYACIRRTRAARRTLWARKSPTRGACTTSTATCGSGARIGMIPTTTQTRQRTILRGLQLASSACFAAVHGAARRVAAGRRSATATGLGAAAPAWASASRQFRRNLLRKGRRATNRRRPTSR